MELFNFERENKNYSVLKKTTTLKLRNLEL